jgi:hypothetical protein
MSLGMLRLTIGIEITVQFARKNEYQPMLQIIQ